MLINGVLVKVCAQTVNGEQCAQLEAVSQKTPCLHALKTRVLQVHIMGKLVLR